MKLTYNSSEQLSLSELLFPWKLIIRMRAHYSLLKQFTKREIEKRYKGTLLGLFWSFFTPLLMLAVYTVVFGFIFRGSYGHPGETKIQFALGLFCGMLVWDLIAHALTSAPMLIINNANLVTKVVFPLEILPVATIGGILVHTTVGFVPLLLLIVISQGMISLSALCLFLIFIPVVFYCLGISWILSALGVFLRDIGAVMPAAVLISMAREALVFGQWVDWKMYGTQLILSLIVMMVGYVFFMKVKSAFADVL